MGRDCEGEPELPTTELLTCCDQTQMMGSFRNENGECFCLVGMLKYILLLLCTRY